MSEESRMTLRLPADLYEWLKIDAANNRRSLNAQVVEILDSHRRQTEKQPLTPRPDAGSGE